MLRPGSKPSPTLFSLPRHRCAVTYGAWSHRASIHMLEGCVVLWGLLRAAEDLALYGTRLLSITDNLSAVPSPRAGLHTGRSTASVAAPPHV